MPSFRHEISLGRRSGAVICGVDEVGRGPLAGPVLACAAILPPDGLSTRLLGALEDSKRLSAEVRETLALKLRAKAIYAIAEASVAEIGRHNNRAPHPAARGRRGPSRAVLRARRSLRRRGAFRLHRW